MTSPPLARRARHTAFVLAAVLVAVGVGCAKTDTATTGSASGTNAPGAIVFPLPADPSAAIKASGLPELGSESFVVHEHAHLDLVINGQAVTVPAGIGINGRSGISPLHTHDTTGTIHIEAEKPDTFTLGQFFTEWGVKLDANCVATFCTDDKNQLLAFVNGQPAPDPAAIHISQHAEIYVWYGPRSTPPTPPASYTFPSGV